MDEEALQEFRQAWSIGSEAFRRECLEQMEGKVGENHPGQTRLETAAAKADRIVAAVQRTGVPFTMAWQMRVDPHNLQVKALLEGGNFGRVFMARRRHCLTTVKEIAGRLNLGKPKGARTNLHKYLNHTQPAGSQAQLDI